MQRFLSISLILLALSCQKEDVIPVQTRTLLQNKWTVVSSSVVFPANPSLNSRYKGVPADYYLFGTNDTLIISQSGQVSLLTQPLHITTNYSFLDASALSYNSNAKIKVRIKTLTNNLLVLTNSASASFINADQTVTTYDGTKIDSLSR